MTLVGARGRGMVGGTGRELGNLAEAGKAMSKAGIGTLGQAEATVSWIHWCGPGTRPLCRTRDNSVDGL